MSSPSRTILVMAVMALGGVVALAWMAQRYGDVLTRRSATSALPDGTATPVALAERDAERLVEAYVGVGRTLARLAAQGTSAEPQAVTRARVLAAHGLTPEQHQELEALFRAWRSGSREVPPAYRAAFDRRRDQLDGMAID